MIPIIVNLYAFLALLGYLTYGVRGVVIGFTIACGITLSASLSLFVKQMKSETPTKKG